MVVASTRDALEAGKLRKDKKEKLIQLTTELMLAAFEWIRVEKGDKLYFRAHGDILLRPVNEFLLTNMVREMYKKAWGQIPTADYLVNIVKTVRLNIVETREYIDTRYIQIADTLLWDMESAQHVDVGQMPDGSPYPLVFRRIFDTPSVPPKHVANVQPFTDSCVQRLLRRYHETLDELDSGKFIMKNDVIETWTDGNDDVYFDLMKCMAAIFVKNKPLGCFLLIGNTRNGKSTFIGMVKTMVGSNNCSDVRLSQIGDWHHMHTLSGVMFNAPDEDEDKAAESQADFKTLADHGELSCKTMHSQEPLKLHTDFVCAFPMNHFPKYQGSGAAACVKRSLAIHFDHDLSDRDGGNVEFEKVTFTQDFMVNLVADVLAYATYYSSHKWTFSPTMDAARGVLEEEVSSGTVYKKAWEKYFCGFQKFTTLYNDYYNWTKIHDYPTMKKKDFNALWIKYLGRQRQRLVEPVTKQPFKVYKVPNRGSNGLVMFDRTKGPISKKSVVELSDPDSLVKQSIVYEFEQLEEKKNERFGRQTN